MMENISAKGYFEMFMDYIYSTEPAKKRFFFSFAAAVSLYKYQYFFGCEKEKVVYFLYIERRNA